MDRIRNAIPLTALALTLAATLGMGTAQAQDKAPPQKAPREIRYCTNCATVESVKVLPATAAGTSQVELVLRYANGSVKAFRYDNDPGLRVGEKVKDNNGVVVRDVAGKPSP